MGWQAMRKTYALSKLAAAAVTIGGLFLPLTSTAAKERPVVVTAPPENAANLVVRRVSYADLDLAVPAGVTELNDRVRFAIGEVCEEANLFDNGSTSYRWGTMQCRGIAWDGARPQIAQAIRRADDIAATGWSPIAATAITISAKR
jgi:UrcA family protein